MNGLRVIASPPVGELTCGVDTPTTNDTCWPFEGACEAVADGNFIACGQVEYVRDGAAAKFTKSAAPTTHATIGGNRAS